jgi:serine/threonine-protein kinase
MNLDDMKQRWEEQDRKLDAVLRLNARLAQASTLSRAETAMRRLSRLLKIEVLLNFGLVLWLGSFLGDHWTEVRFLPPALVLDLGAIALLAAGIHQLIALGNVDYDEPVVTIQKRLGSLRAQRLRATMLTLLVSPLLWIPLLIVGLKGLLGLDAYAIFDHDWLLANVLFGVAVIPVAVWLARRYADRMERSPLVQRLLRDLAGHNLNAAADFLDRLTRFEEEAPPEPGL